MTDPTKKNGRHDGEAHENSYAADDAPDGAPEAPDVLQPGPAGDFGNASPKGQTGNAKSAALPSKRSSSRTPGDQPESGRQADDEVADQPGDAAEPKNTYSGT
jgi:hypothetical protein